MTSVFALIVIFVVSRLEFNEDSTKHKHLASHYSRTMADLHFTVQDHNGSHGGGPQMIPPQEVPMAGEMDHLPNHAAAAEPAQQSTLEYMQEQFNSSAHPSVVVFHILFKALAIFLYILGGIILHRTGGSAAEQGGGKFIILTVVIILLLAADFWVVKNVTGRLLVGLRWWNKVNEDSTTWIFESSEQTDHPKPINKFDKSFFWTVLYATPFVWVGMLVIAILNLEINWFMVCIMALALSCSNVYGYYKCSSDQKARFQQLVQRGAQQGAMAVVSSSMLSVLTGQNAAASNNRTTGPMT